jgi:hypothetical protein
MQVCCNTRRIPVTPPAADATDSGMPILLWYLVMNSSKKAFDLMRKKRFRNLFTSNVFSVRNLICYFGYVHDSIYLLNLNWFSLPYLQSSTLPNRCIVSKMRSNIDVRFVSSMSFRCNSSPFSCDD